MHLKDRDTQTCNLDESNMLASEGCVNGVGSRGKKKHKKMWQTSGVCYGGVSWFGNKWAH